MSDSFNCDKCGERFEWSERVQMLEQYLCPACAGDFAEEDYDDSWTDEDEA